MRDRKGIPFSINKTLLIINLKIIRNSNLGKGLQGQRILFVGKIFNNLKNNPQLLETLLHLRKF
jgi:hypothetical protein